MWGVARWPLETAFVLRLAFVLVAKRGDPLAGDELFYSNQAFELTRGKWYLWPNTLLQSFVGHPTAAHPPLTSTMLAPVAGLTGAAPLALRLAMVLLGVVVVLLIGRLALEIAGPRASTAAAGLAAVAAPLVLSDGSVMSETPSIVVLLGATLVALRFRRGPSVRLAVALGALVGLMMLGRSEFVILAPIVMAVAILGAWRAGRATIALSALTVGAALVLPGAWVFRNAAVFAEPTFTSSQDGFTLIGSYCDDVWDGPGVGLWTLGCLREFDLDNDGTDDLTELLGDTDPYGALDESQVAAAYRERAVEYAKDHRGDLPRVASFRVLRMLGWYHPSDTLQYGTGEGRQPWLGWIAIVEMTLLLPLAAVGAVTLYRRRQRTVLGLLLAQMALAIAMAAIVYGLWRFRSTFDVSVLVLAGVGLATLAERSRLG